MKRRHVKRTPHHKKHTYTNLLLVALGFITAVFLAKLPVFASFLLGLGSYVYLGAFIAGVLFVCTPTAAIGALMLAILAKDLPVITLCLIAGVGAVAADLVMFHVVEDGLLTELEDIYNQFDGRKLSHILHIRAFRWTLPVIGALIIASPLPDELGVGLMGISKLNAWRFAGLSWILNSVGIFTAISALLIIHPA
jgi:hypothetical protein